MEWWNGNWGWQAWITMMVFMLGLWALLIWTVAAIVRGATRSDPDRLRDPEEILAGRFARGEIDEDALRERRNLLRSLR